MQRWKKRFNFAEILKFKVYYMRKLKIFRLLVVLTEWIVAAVAVNSEWSVKRSIIMAKAITPDIEQELCLYASWY